MKKNKSIKDYLDDIINILNEKEVEYDCEHVLDNGKDTYNIISSHAASFIALDSKKKFNGVVLNYGVYKRYVEEGFSDEWIDCNAPIWITCKTVEDLMKFLLPNERKNS